MNSKYIVTLCSVLALSTVTACGDDDIRPTPDGGMVIRLDGGGDAGPIIDSGPRPDGGPRGCDVGEACDPTRGCRVSPDCIDAFATEIGGADDPITGLPGGAMGIPLTSWTGGYCSTVGAIDMGGCDPNDDASCGGLDCATCVNAGTDTRGVTVGLCAKTCTPSLTANPCRDTFECSRTIGACLPGCQSDNECRVQRPDTNMNGVIDPYEAATAGMPGTGNPMGDHLVYDDSTMAMCNTATARCEHMGAMGAEAGDTCETDFDCEENGDCIADFGDEGGWPGGGYCTKFGCDIAGNDCAGMGKCQERGIGIALCVQACEVGAVVMAGDMFADSRDCRAGYSCFWDGSGGAVAGNGACVPGNYNDVTTPNVGLPCVDETTCYSPYGLGQCRDFTGSTDGSGNHCTLFDCAAPGLTGLCGAGALCTSVMGSDTTLCAKTCTTAADCPLAADGCWDTTPAGIVTSGATICFPGCVEDANCRTGQTCVGASMTSVGECM